MPRVDNIGVFVLLKFENKIEKAISDFIYNSRHCDKSKSALKLIRFLNCLPFISIRTSTKLSTLSIPVESFIIQIYIYHNGLIPPKETDSDSDSDSDSFPDGYIVPCTTFSTGLDLDLDPFPIVLISMSVSESESESSGGNKP